MYSLPWGVSAGGVTRSGVERGYLRVPDEGARSLGEDDRERVVVVGGVGVFEAEGLGGGGGVDAGGLFGSGGAAQAGAGDGGCHVEDISVVVAGVNNCELA